jgi:hypothetical protein
MKIDSFNRRDFFVKQYPVWKNDWNKFAKDVCHVRLDDSQQTILYAIQTNRRVSVRSGNARGKDFVAAVASVCFLYLTVFDDDFNFQPAKVVNTAPTGRQVNYIMIPEIAKFFSRSKGVLPGNMMADGIRFDDKFLKDWYLVGFKAGDEAIEAWTGFHAPNVMVVVTEASGIDQVTFDSIESILQGNSRLVLIFNPNRMVGEAYKSQSSPIYKKFVLNCLNAPNVVNRKLFIEGKITEQEMKDKYIPGQVDYDWIDEKVKKPGWAYKISKDEINKAELDFEWNGEWYRPSDLFRIKVLGEFPKESEEQLIPISWVEAAQERYKLQMEQGWKITGRLKMGVDVAGMGRNMTVFCKRKDEIVFTFDVYAKSSHMVTAGRIKNILEGEYGAISIIDTIGEGAGVYSRLEEQGVGGAVSCKFSESAQGMKDKTEGYEFVNMRAFLYWCIRDWLNPAFDSKACLPPDDELMEELTSIEYQFQSNGKIQIESKDEIVKRIGRSPDKADALANTFYPSIERMSSLSDLSGMFH